MELLIPRYGHTEWDTRATHDRAVADAFLSGANFLAFRTERASVVEYTVDVRTLDSYAIAPDIIKIDAEGAAAAVIRGAREMIQKHQPVVLIEDAEGEPMDEMAMLGYRSARYDPRSGRFALDATGDLNTFFIMDHHRDVLTPAFIEPRSR